MTDRPTEQDASTGPDAPHGEGNQQSVMGQVSHDRWRSRLTWVLIVACVGFLCLLIRTAWRCDNAFTSFRSVRITLCQAIHQVTSAPLFSTAR